MNLTQDQIRRLLKLTGLSTKNQGNVSIESIIESFESLKGANIEGITDIQRSGNQLLRLRPDIVSEQTIVAPDDLLATSKQKIAGHQIALSGIMHTDS